MIRPSRDRRLGWGILFRPVLAQRTTLGVVLALSLISAGFSLAQGTHTELLESSTTYQRLARHQLLPLSDAG